MFYVYVLQSHTQKLYYGSTNDLRRRLKEHQTGKSFYTSGKVWRLVYYEAYLAEEDARLREQSLKHYGQGRTHIKKRIGYSLDKK